MLLRKLRSMIFCIKMYKQLVYETEEKEKKLELWKRMTTDLPKYNNSSGYVYIYTSPQMIVEDLYKIGQTTNINARRTELNCSNPNGEFIKVYETSKPDIIEKKIHSLYKDINYKKEWFVIKNFSEFLVQLDEQVRGIELFLIKDLDKIVGKMVKQKVKALGGNVKNIADKSLQLINDTSSSMKITGQPYQYIMENIFIYNKIKTSLDSISSDLEIKLVKGFIVEFKNKKLIRHIWVKINGQNIDSAARTYDKGEYKVKMNLDKKNSGDFVKCASIDDGVVDLFFTSYGTATFGEIVAKSLNKKTKEYYEKLCLC